MSLRSEKKTRKTDFEFSLSDKSGPNDNPVDLDKTSSGNSTTVVPCKSQESTAVKYEELGPIRVEKSNYETLRKGEESSPSQGREIKEPYNGQVMIDGGSDDKNYEELLTAPPENSYESLRNDDNSNYANT